MHQSGQKTYAVNAQEMSYQLDGVVWATYNRRQSFKELRELFINMIRQENHRSNRINCFELYIQKQRPKTRTEKVREREKKTFLGSDFDIGNVNG